MQQFSVGVHGEDFFIPFYFGHGVAGSNTQT